MACEIFTPSTVLRYSKVPKHIWLCDQNVTLLVYMAETLIKEIMYTIPHFSFYMLPFQKEVSRFYGVVEWNGTVSIYVMWYYNLCELICMMKETEREEKRVSYSLCSKKACCCWKYHPCTYGTGP